MNNQYDMIDDLRQLRRMLIDKDMAMAAAIRERQALFAEWGVANPIRQREIQDRSYQLRVMIERTRWDVNDLRARIRAIRKQDGNGEGDRRQDGSGMD